MNRAECCVLAAVGFCAVTIIAAGAVTTVPVATSSFDLVLSGSTRDSVGRVVTVTAPAHVEVSEPPPIPVPVGTKILRVESANGAATVSVGTSGQSLELVGTGFPLTGTRRLTVAGTIAAVTQWRSDRVFFSLPAINQPVTGATQVWLQVNNNWVLQAVGPAFTVMPPPVPPPVPNPPAGPLWPRVDKVLDQNLNPKDVFLTGEPIILSGQNFGNQKGHLFVNGFPVTPTAWSDTQIRFTWNSANRAHRLFVVIERADRNRTTAGGGSDSRPKMPYVVMPGQTVLP